MHAQGTGMLREKMVFLISRLPNGFPLRKSENHLVIVVLYSVLFTGQLIN
jgi:hypothetical protein